MSLRLWHVRRAVPWLSMGVCLGTAALGVALVSWQERMAYVVLPLVALLTAAGVAFVLDDPAGDVTRVTPRGSRWVPANRLSVAVLLTGSGVGLTVLAPGEVGGLAGWPLVVLALALASAAVAAWCVRRHQHSPGAAVASALVLLGLVPFAAARLFDGAWPYPSPTLSSAARDRWLVVAAVAAVALAWAVLRPLPRRTTGRRRETSADSAAGAPVEARGGVRI